MWWGQNLEPGQCRGPRGEGRQAGRAGVQREAALLAGEVTVLLHVRCRCSSQLQPLLLQPQLPHPVTVLPATPAPKQGQCWGQGWLRGREGVVVKLLRCLSHLVSLSHLPLLSRFLGVSSLPASRALSGRGEPRDMTATPPCQLTGSTVETPLLGFQTGVGLGQGF